MPKQNGERGGNGNVDSEEGNNSPKGRQRREPALRSAVSEIMKLQPDHGSMEAEFEHLICGVKNKEVEFPLAKQMHLCNEKWGSGNETHPSNPRILQLRFLNKLSLPVLTGTKIKGERDTSIGIELFDVLTGQVVTAGPEASAKVEIVVLEKDFAGYEGDNWSLEVFNSMIVGEREGKKSLLTGDVYLNLKHGIGFIGAVCFRHTKRWMRMQEYRLGARIVDGSHGARVREAKTEPFIVEDRRGKLYQKHYPPSLSDAVWRLDNIGKGGAFLERLNNENIYTVKDFVTLLNLNPQRLKDILGANMPARTWDITVNHARTCRLDKTAHLYFSSTSQQKTAVVFNVVGQLMGLLMELQFIPAVKMSETEKADALKLIVSAFEQWEQVVPVDDEAFEQWEQVYPSSLTTLESPNACNFETSDLVDLSGNTQQDSHSTDAISLVGSNSLDDFDLLGFENLDDIIDQPLCFQSEISNSSESVRQDINDDYMNFLFWNGREEVIHAEHRSLQLWFLNDISSPVFVGFPIEGNDRAALKIAIFDEMGQVVSSGPASLSKVEIVVRDGDSDGDADNGMLEEFKTNIIGEREQKKPLLAGDTLLDLKDGIGMVSEIFFTECSSRARSCYRLRLGARVVNMDGITVREAKTEPFIVSDQHRDLYKKHHPPSLTDEVWRLEEILKDGVFHRRLSSKNMNTVKDFLTLLSIDPPMLQHILGTGMSAKMWDTLVDHAQTCILDQRLYLYSSPGSLQKSGVVFNVVGQVMGLISECQYVSIDQLSESAKVDSLKLVIYAFNNWEDVVPIDDGASLCLPNVLYSSHDILPPLYSPWDANCLGEYDSPTIEDITRRYEQTLTFTSPVTSSTICITESMIDSFCDDQYLQISDNHFSVQSHFPNSDLKGAPLNVVDDMLLAGSSDVTMNRARRRNSCEKNAQKRWRMLFSIMRWFSVRRNLARKTLLEDIHIDTNASSVNAIRLAHSAAGTMNKAQRRFLSKRDIAQRRWRMLFSLMRWFSVKRNVARKTPFREMPKNLGPSSGDIMSSTGGMNSFNDVGLQNICDFDHRYEQPSSFPVHLQLLNTHWSAQSQNSELESHILAANDTPLARSAVVGVNKTHRRYILKRSKAQKRWRLLFSIVRWFSVRRNVARKTSIEGIPFKPNSLDNNGLQSTHSTNCRHEEPIRHLSVRNKAQRRWRVLFSVVRWFSVRRNVARRGRVIDVPGFC